jgi:hypothetical protein
VVPADPTAGPSVLRTSSGADTFVHMGDAGQGTEQQRGSPRDWAIAIPVLAAFMVGVGLLDWHRRGAVVGVVAPSLCLVVVIGLAVVARRVEIRRRRVLRFVANAFIFSCFFWALAIGVQDGPLARIAATAAGFGLAMAAWHTWVYSRPRRRSDYFVTMSSTSSPSAGADRRRDEAGVEDAAGIPPATRHPLP